jgi:hypothetical protein
MLIKKLTLYSLVYIGGIASSVAMHDVISSAGTSQSSAGVGTPMFNRQIANRSLKSDRLPINPAKRQVNDKEPLQAPLNSKIGSACKPPIDVLGRCFADARANKKYA